MNARLSAPGAPATNSGPTSGVRGRLWLVLRLLLRRGLPAGAARRERVVVYGAMVAGGGLVIATAAIHLHLWLIGYRHVPRLGVLFILQAVFGLLLGPVIILGRHHLAVVTGAVYMAASATGLILSATVGFVGVHDSLSVPWATTSLVIELIGFVILGAVSVVLLWPRQPAALHP